jgi:putative endonuclease
VSASAERRRRTHARGLWAEALALVYLLSKGYRPLARRFAASGGEVDLIVARGDAVVFVEVKARGEMGAALEAIGPQKRRRFSRAARAWVARHPASLGRTLRADAVFVAPGRWPQHVVGAFEIEM